MRIKIINNKNLYLIKFVMAKLFIDDFEYKLDYVKMINKKVLHFAVERPTSFIIENFDFKNEYMCTVHFNNQIFEMGETVETYNTSSNKKIYYIGENNENCVCFKYEKKYKIIYPLFVSLPVGLISLKGRSRR